MTTILGVIGDPVTHSLSPVMQSAGIKSAGIDAVYKMFPVTPAQLADFVTEVRQNAYHGFNVTLPHKQRIAPYLDEIVPEAEAIGAVNTVLNRNGHLIGYNTDATGYLRSLTEEQQWQPEDKTITLLGAGGAARAIGYGLLQADIAQLYLVNRTADKAVAMAEELSRVTRHESRVKAMPWSQLPSCLSATDLLINATSVGLDGTRFDNLPLDTLQAGALVSDLVYTPRRTPLLAEADALAYTTHEGLGMLLYQGAEAFQIWFEKEADITAMRQALLGALGD